MKALSTLILGILGLWTLTAHADPTFYSTSTPSAWTVDVNHLGYHVGDGQFSSFTTDNFIPAVSINGRTGWISMNSSGTSAYIGYWTYMVFRQTFDLTGYDPATVNLQFQWAADDSGEGYADRGLWIPAFSLNGGALTNYPGSTNAHRIPTYGYSSTVSVTNGFVAGVNTVDFYVEGNGVTDGFALQTISFTAAPPSVGSPVPEPATMLLIGSGLLGLAGLRKKLV